MAATAQKGIGHWFAIGICCPATVCCCSRSSVLLLGQQCAAAQATVTGCNTYQPKALHLEALLVRYVCHVHVCHQGQHTASMDPECLLLDAMCFNRGNAFLGLLEFKCACKGIAILFPPGEHKGHDTACIMQGLCGSETYIARHMLQMAVYGCEMALH